MASPKLRRDKIELPEAEEDAFLQSIPISKRAELTKLEQPEGGLQTLACSVVRADGTPIWTREEWDIFAGNEPERFYALVNQSLTMSGLMKAEEKKAETPS